MGLFSSVAKVSPEQMGIILYQRSKESALKIYNTLNDVSERDMKNKDDAFLIPVLCNLFLYNVGLCDQYSMRIVDIIMNSAFDVMIEDNPNNRLNNEDTINTIYGMIGEMLNRPWIDDITENPYAYFTEFYYAQVYGVQLDSFVAKLAITQAVHDTSITCKSILNEFKII